MLILFICCCFVLGAIGSFHLLLNWSLRFWPIVPAKLTYCEISRIKSQVASNVWVFSLATKLEYEFNGKRYHNGKLTLSGAIKAQDLNNLTAKKAVIATATPFLRVCPIIPSLGVMELEPLSNKAQYYYISAFGFGVAALTLIINEILYIN